jgi:uncharacterized membrane protein
VRRHRSPWTITLIYAAAAVAAGLALPRLENRLLPTLISPISISAATAIYSSTASGMIALTGIVFSLTFVMVQFSATAYSPRLVLWFARDPFLSHALGTFTATFLYAIAGLAWIDRSGATPGHVPLISALTVLGLLVTSVVMFIGLIDRVALLQISRTLAFTGDLGRHVINAIYPRPSTAAPGMTLRLPARAAPTQIVTHSGPPLAVERLEVDTLVALATAADAVIEIAVAVGDTVEDSMPLLRVFGARTHLDERRLTNGVVLGVERTFEQDPKYAIRLLVDIAIRALSPAINDPTTAVQALDQIGDLLLRLGRRQLQIGAVCDARGALRLTMPAPTWEDFLWLAFGEISVYGASSLQVMRRMHALVADLAEAVPSERRASLHYWRTRLRRRVTASFTDADDRAIASIEDRQGFGVSRRASGM